MGGSPEVGALPDGADVPGPQGGVREPQSGRLPLPLADVHLGQRPVPLVQGPLPGAHPR